MGAEALLGRRPGSGTARRHKEIMGKLQIWGRSCRNRRCLRYPRPCRSHATRHSASHCSCCRHCGQAQHQELGVFRVSLRAPREVFLLSTARLPASAHRAQSRLEHTAQISKFPAPPRSYFFRSRPTSKATARARGRSFDFVGISTESEILGGQSARSLDTARSLRLEWGGLDPEKQNFGDGLGDGKSYRRLQVKSRSCL